MKGRLTPFASVDAVHNLAKVGKSKSPLSLAARMPSPEIAAKVGGGGPIDNDISARRVVRMSAQR